MAAAGELDGDRGGDVVLPTPPLPMVRMTPWPVARSSSISVPSSAERRRQAPRSPRVASAGRGAAASGRRRTERAARSMPMGAQAEQRHAGARQARPGRPASRRAPRRCARSSARATGSCRSVAVNTPLTNRRWLHDADRGQLRARALGLGQRRRARGARRATSVVVPPSAERREARLVERALRLQAGERPRHEVPVVFVAMKPVQAAGSLSSRSVCPVGAVSKITWSNRAVVAGSPSRPVNSSKAAISTRAGAGELLLDAGERQPSGSTPR